MNYINFAHRPPNSIKISNDLLNVYKYSKLNCGILLVDYFQDTFSFSIIIFKVLLTSMAIQGRWCTKTKNVPLLHDIYTWININLFYLSVTGLHYLNTKLSSDVANVRPSSFAFILSFFVSYFIYIKFRLYEILTAIDRFFSGIKLSFEVLTDYVQHTSHRPTHFVFSFHILCTAYNSV